MEGWRRDMYFDDTGLPWVLPSPNIPTLDSAIVFSGPVHVEGTNVSEGRGTTRPFELVGAPWIEAEKFAGALTRVAFPACISARRCSNRRFRSMRASPVAAVRSTCSIAPPSSPSSPVLH